mgnify:CR=1 FL=1|jgi:hypothetical protein|tara:strand:+ start:1329 stop:1913 length:585 start_codon:yes stop_codon:yes gene_type:complete
MEPFDAYQYHNALKLHFTSKYDAIKYRFKTSATQQSFWKRKDKYFFSKVAKRFDDKDELIKYYVAHLVNDCKWVGEMITKEEEYQNWLKVNESLSYNIKQDLHALESKYSSFDDVLMTGNRTYPSIIHEYLSKEIGLETVVVVNSLTGFVEHANKHVVDTILWPELYAKINNYAPFIVSPSISEKIKNDIIRIF